ncbi:MAG: hypothetical protein WCE51_07810 [Chthoniobacterales bacterium]
MIFAVGLRRVDDRFPFTSVNSIASPYLLPISLALLAKYAPQAIPGTIIGLYYLAFFYGNSLVGWVGGFYQTMPTTTFLADARRSHRRLRSLLRDF